MDKVITSRIEGSDFMNTTIRRCMISDAHAIYELCREELGYDFSEEQVVQNVRRLIGSPEILLMVAVDSEDKVLGFIHANNHDPIYAPPMKDIVAIAVNPEFRHHGLGRRLILAVEGWARETGAKGVRANSDIRQKNALAFYKSMGYEYIRSIYNVRKMF